MSVSALAPAQGLESQRRSETTTLQDGPTDKVLQQLESDTKSGSADGDGDDLLVVDWDGPDDPENPKK
jgi:hypothetical protein